MPVPLSSKRNRGGFQKEKEFLEAAHQFLVNHRASDPLWPDAYAEMIAKYADLLNDAEKITAAGDLSYKRLIKAKEEIETLNKEMYHLAVYDSLTQIYNRHYLMDQLTKEFAKASRYLTPLALIMMDLDFFKAINDEFGHQAGDKVLSTLASRLKKEIRQQDTLGRYGGEEFLLILPGIDIHQATRVAQKMLELTSNKAFSFEKNQIPVTLSIGVAALHSSCANAEALLKNADRALYKAKNQGRNQLVLAPLD
ncbi:MAG: GGDEF domain-containing protein [Acidobacteria bacterium]|nr:GGDEF domain-containing protein [Acidobacteriota bacterium]